MIAEDLSYLGQGMVADHFLCDGARTGTVGGWMQAEIREVFAAVRFVWWLSFRLLAEDYLFLNILMIFFMQSRRPTPSPLGLYKAVSVLSLAVRQNAFESCSCWMQAATETVESVTRLLAELHIAPHDTIC